MIFIFVILMMEHVELFFLFRPHSEYKYFVLSTDAMHVPKTAAGQSKSEPGIDWLLWNWLAFRMPAQNLSNSIK